MLDHVRGGVGLVQFIVVVEGKIVGQISWDGICDLPIPAGAVLLTIPQASELNLPQ